MTYMHRCTLFLLLLTLSFAGYADDKAPFLSAENCKGETGQKALYGAQCGYLKLPENHNGESQRNLDIYVLRLPSIRDSAKPPIFFIAGGPGQASSEHARNFQHMLKALQVEHDFIFVDQRGTGKSNPLNCDFDPNEFAELTPSKVEEKAIETIEGCIDSYQDKADLTRYTTPYAVKDLEAVREALGYNKIMLWGGSYGTRVILEYLRSYPQSLAATILDAVAPVSLQIPFNAEHDASQALSILFEHCQSQTACQKAFPNLKSRWKELLNKLKGNPSPQIMQHPRTEQDEEIYINDVVLSMWVRFILYSRDITPILPLAIDKATQGDYALLYTVASLSSHKVMEQISEGMQAAVLCAEDWQYSQRQSGKQKEYERLVHLASPEEGDKMCRLFPKGDLPDAYFSEFTAEVPSLLLSGQFDPVTPPYWGDVVLSYLSKAKHIVAPGGHHIISGSGCVPQLIEEFVKAPAKVESINSECVNKIRPSPYFIDKAGPALIKIEGEPKS